MAVLRLGWPGWGWEDYEPMAVGQLDSVSHSGGHRWTLRFMDGLAALRSRITKNPSEASYLQDLPISTINEGAPPWTATGYPKSLTLTDASDFLDPATVGHDCGISILTTGAYGIYWRYSAKAGNVLTVEQEDWLGTGTAAASYANGTGVKQVAIYDGHPLTILHRLLSSNGSGLNGSGDVYLSAMGLGVPQEFIDAQSFDMWKGERSPSSGTWRAQIGRHSPQVNGFDWLMSQFCPAGFIPVVRQGRYAGRAILSPLDMPSFDPTHHISDEHIARVESWQGYDEQQSAEAAEVSVWTATSGPPEYDATIAFQEMWAQFTGGEADGQANANAATVFRTSPHAARWDIDLSGMVYTNETAIAQEVADIMAGWLASVPQRVSLLLRGWGWLQLCCGDKVYLSTSHAGPPDETMGAPYNWHQAMVTSHPVPVGPYTRIELLVPRRTA
jgi:hypothetical protein